MKKLHRIPTAIDLPMPVFYGNLRNIHPIDFLLNLGKYFRTEKLLTENSCCLKRTAAQWYSMIKYRTRTFEEFEYHFC